jgi:hypothetical protein
LALEATAVSLVLFFVDTQIHEPIPKVIVSVRHLGTSFLVS